MIMILTKKSFWTISGFKIKRKPLREHLFDRQRLKDILNLLNWKARDSFDEVLTRYLPQFGILREATTVTRGFDVEMASAWKTWDDNRMSASKEFCDKLLPECQGSFYAAGNSEKLK